MQHLGRTLSAFLVAATVTTPVLAIQEATPEPGWRYRVAGVAADDRLNLRAQPGAASAIVGALASDASNVVVSGLRQEIGGSVWWEIYADGKTGWANARYLTPMSVDDEKETGFPLACTGTEPFWGLTLENGQATLTEPGAADVFFGAEQLPSPASGPGTIVYRLADASVAGHLVAIRTYDFCSDGMSDRQFPFAAIVITPDQVVRSGCCHRAG